MKIKVKDFVENLIQNKVTNTKVNPQAIEEFVRANLEIVDYVPFQRKCDIINVTVDSITTVEDGITKVNSVTQFVVFIVAMLASHTNLEIMDAVEDYDLLNKHGLIEPIVKRFEKDYLECEALFKAAIADRLAENNLSVVVNKFLNGVLAKFDNLGDGVKKFMSNIDLSKLLGVNIKEEDIAKIVGLADKLNK